MSWNQIKIHFGGTNLVYFLGHQIYCMHSITLCHLRGTAWYAAVGIASRADENFKLPLHHVVELHLVTSQPTYLPML